MPVATRSTKSIKPRVSFMSIPPEIREQIYQHYFAAPPDDDSRPIEFKVKSNAVPTILLANRKIHSEASWWYQQSGWFGFSKSFQTNRAGDVVYCGPDLLMSTGSTVGAENVAQCIDFREVTLKYGRSCELDESPNPSEWIPYILAMQNMAAGGIEKHLSHEYHIP